MLQIVGPYVVMIMDGPRFFEGFLLIEASTKLICPELHPSVIPAKDPLIEQCCS